MKMSIEVCPRTLNLLRIACETVGRHQPATERGLEARYDYACLADLLSNLERASNGDHRADVKYTWDVRHDAEHLAYRAAAVAPYVCENGSIVP